MSKSRLAYIDGLRGLAMSMVVYTHSELFIFHTNSPLYQILFTLQLPLFFFVSGLLTKKAFDIASSWYKSWQKIKDMMIPTIIMGSLFALIFGYFYTDLFFTPFKLGYWFTFALSGMIIINNLLNMVSVRVGLTSKQNNVLYICAIIVSIVMLMLINKLMSHGNHDINLMLDLFSLPMISNYFIFFCLGFLYRVNTESVSILKKWPLLFMLISMFVVLYVFHLRVDTILTFLTTNIVGVTIIYALFKYKINFESRHLLCNALVLVGRYTLPIYLFHYFLIQSFSRIIKLLNIEVSVISQPIICMIALIITVLFITISIGLAKITTRIPWLYRLTFGKIPFINK